MSDNHGAKLNGISDDDDASERSSQLRFPTESDRLRRGPVPDPSYLPRGEIQERYPPANSCQRYPVRVERSVPRNSIPDLSGSHAGAAPPFYSHPPPDNAKLPDVNNKLDRIYQKIASFEDIDSKINQLSQRIGELELLNKNVNALAEFVDNMSNQPNELAKLFEAFQGIVNTLTDKGIITAAQPAAESSKQKSCDAEAVEENDSEESTSKAAKKQNKPAASADIQSSSKNANTSEDEPAAKEAVKPKKKMTIRVHEIVQDKK